MAFAYGTEIQNRVAGMVLNRSYSDLQAWQKTILDNTSAANPPTAGAAKTVLQRTQQLFQWLNLGAVATLPDAAEQYFIADLCLEFARATKEQEIVRRFEKELEQATLVAVNSFSRYGPTDAETDFSTLTLQTIRYHVINWLARRNPIHMVPVDDIDQAAMWVINWIWNRTDWTFRRKTVTFTIATNSTVTISGSNVLDAFIVRDLYVAGTSYGAFRIKWADADVMAYQQAIVAAGSVTGPPRLFRFVRSAADALTWQFYPTPDQSYTAYGEIVIAGPGTPSSVSDTTPFAKFPATFVPIIKDMVRAKVAESIGAREAPGMVASAINAVDSIAVGFDDIGDIVSGASTVDMNMDVVAQRGCNVLGGDGSL